MYGTELSCFVKKKNNNKQINKTKKPINVYLFSESRENHHMETTFSNVFYFFVYIFELLLASNTLFKTRSRAHVILFFSLFKTTVLHTVFLCRAYENHGHDERNIRVNLLGFIQSGGGGRFFT